MNYKKMLYGVSTLAICSILTGCHMSHEWQEATCTTPKTCSVGGETEGEALGHTWIEATCSEPKHCSVCDETEGNTLEHTWIEATCSEPKHCSVCGGTEGNALEHTLAEANYQQAATCEVCDETVGEPLQADFDKYGLVCNAELDVTRDFVASCITDGYTTTGTITFSDYETFSSDDTHDALEGYEWKVVTVTKVFDDDNARDYGVINSIGYTDYYNIALLDDANTVNYNGVDYTEFNLDFETLQDGWEDPGILTKQYRIYVQVPIGYDGIVIYNVSNKKLDNKNYKYFNELADENSVCFRLE